MKLGIIIDSSAGLTRAEAEKKNYVFLPLYLYLNEKEYVDGETIDANKFYGIADLNMTTRTSATPMGVIEKSFKDALKKFDQVIVLPLSSGLSSQYANIKMVSKDFDKVHVIENYGVGNIILESAELAKKMASQGKDIKEIVKEIEVQSKRFFGIVIPKNLKWLVKGGRISPAVAKMANLMKIVPMIKLENGKLDKFGKGRVFKKTTLKAAKAVKDHCKNDSAHIYVGKFEGSEEIIKIIKGQFKNIKISMMPPVVATHTGPEVIAVLAEMK